MKDFIIRPGALSALGLALVLGACASTQSEDSAAVEIRGTDPSGAATGALPPPSSVSEPIPQTVVPGEAVAAGTPGVVDYGDYRVAVAESGDTVASLAGRIGMSAAELGSYNGLQPSSPLRQGDELVLPDNVTIQVAAASPAAAQPLPDASSVESVPLGGETEIAALPSDGGETVWSPARAAAAIERSNDPESAPVPQTAPQQAAPQVAALPEPPSAQDPVPAAPPEPEDIVPADLGQYQGNTNLATPFQLTRPVEGTVAVPFNLAGGPERNEGVDFAATPGTPVVAAEDGEVALVSESLGGLGTIVLIRHPDDYLTVYGRLSDVTVQKGDYLERGQRFGLVADPPAGTEPRMHFEVRKGAESIDPMSML